MRKYVKIKNHFMKINPPKQCRYCCKNLDKPTLEHVIPLSYGGAWDFDNLDWACLECNNKMSIWPSIIKDIKIKKYIKVKKTIINEEIIKILLEKMPNIYIFFKFNKYNMREI